MPGPHTIVTIVDADGDEFPVVVWTTTEFHNAAQIREAAMAELERLVSIEKRFRPTFPVTIPADRNPDLEEEA